MSSGDTKGDTYSKDSKKKVENGKIEGGNNKMKDSRSHGNNEVGSTAGSDLELDSRILSALLTVCNHSTDPCICFLFMSHHHLACTPCLCLFFLFKLVLDLFLQFIY
jgi:hypothetical protein